MKISSKICFLLVVVLLLFALAACSSPLSDSSETSGNTDPTDTATPTAPAQTTGSAPAQTTDSVPAQTTGSAPSQDGGIAGKYCGSYTYNGNEFYVEITINEDGTYKRVYLKNGEPYETTEGDWIMDNSGRTPKIRLYLDEAHSVANIYEYMGNYLQEGSKVFTKQ